MASNSSIRQIVSKSFCLVPKPQQNIKSNMPIYQTRRFFGGRNWDPFSDLNTAVKDLEINSREFEKAISHFGRSMGIPSFSFGRNKGTIQQGVHRINLDLSDFKPEDIKVNLNGQVVTINARMDKKTEDGTQRIVQKMSREYTLPENLQLEKMKSVLSEDGLLLIETPLKLTPEQVRRIKEIPISREPGLDVIMS